MKGWRRYAAAVAAAAVLGLCLRLGAVEGLRVPTGAMEDTLLLGDYILVNRLVYGGTLRLGGMDWGRLPGWRRPRPGDVLVFRLPADPQRLQVGRCIAVGGQTVHIVDKQVRVDGQRLGEPPGVRYGDGRMLDAQVSTRDNFGPLTVPPESFFVLGDQRDNSIDSRVFRAVPLALIEGRAMMVWWSWAPDEKQYHAGPASWPGAVFSYLRRLPGRVRLERLGTVVF